MPEPMIYPLTDLELARRLERAEGEANAAFVEARVRMQPELGAAWISIAGVYAMFDGVDSPLTQTFGLGVFDPIGDAELDAIEAFFTQRLAPVFHEVSPLISLETLARLGERGYRAIELSTVMVRPVMPAPDRVSTMAVRRIETSQSELWSRIAGEGWSSESAELAAFVEAFGGIITQAEGVHCFLAERDGRPIAAGALRLHGDVALLAGASTLPSARKQGAQRALLAARLEFAANHGAGLAMMVAQPGSGSQRNAERQGFRTAYTRTKWQLAGSLQ